MCRNRDWNCFSFHSQSIWKRNFGFVKMMCFFLLPSTSKVIANTDCIGNRQQQSSAYRLDRSEKFNSTFIYLTFKKMVCFSQFIKFLLLRDSVFVSFDNIKMFVLFLYSELFSFFVDIRLTLCANISFSVTIFCKAKCVIDAQSKCRKKHTKHENCIYMFRRDMYTSMGCLQCTALFFSLFIIIYFCSFALPTCSAQTKPFSIYELNSSVDTHIARIPKLWIIFLKNRYTFARDTIE